VRQRQASHTGKITGVMSNQRQPPDLAEDTIVAALRASFGLRVAALALLPVGNDADSWAYRVQAAPGPAWFLKLRAGANPTRGAALPSYLHRHGMPNVLASGRTEATRRAAVEGFKDLFAPGNIVDLARASDAC
jgi:hypothetical protein